MSNKKRVYLHNFNPIWDKAVYLPLAVAYLQAYAQQSQDFRSLYEFQPIRFLRVKKIEDLPSYDRPAIAGFSCSMWNYELSLATAKRIKGHHPECKVVFGGPHVANDARAFMESHPEVDILCHNESEATFLDLALALEDSRRELASTPGITFRRADGAIIRTPDRPKILNLDEIPSPFLTGLFDDFFKRVDQQLLGIWETNRGCPFSCSFCYWGSAINQRVRFFDMDRLREEIAWIAKLKLPFIYCADANFGIRERDLEIAEMLVKTKETHGYPIAFRVNFMKNTTERVFKIAGMLVNAGMHKSVTLSMQTLDDAALVNIKRQNIKLEAYAKLQHAYRGAQIPNYTELILGCPGETKQSFVSGIERLLQSGQYGYIDVYHGNILPNTDFAEPAYQAEHGMKTVRVPLLPYHTPVEFGEQEQVHEYEDIIVHTNTLPTPDWRYAHTLGWLVQWFLCFRLGFFVSLYLYHRHGVRYTDFLDFMIRAAAQPGLTQAIPTITGLFDDFKAHEERLLAGQPKAATLKEFPRLYWSEEEAAYLNLVDKFDVFFQELRILVEAALAEFGVTADSAELDDLFLYQQARIPHYTGVRFPSIELCYNFREYFDAILAIEPIELKEVGPHEVVVVDELSVPSQVQDYANALWKCRREKMFLYKTYAPSKSGELIIA